METILCHKHADLSQRAAAFFMERACAKLNLVVGLPTGRTPSGMYRELRAAHSSGEVDFSGLRTFGIDELVGKGPVGHAYRNYLRLYFYSWSGIPPAHRYHLNGTAKDLRGECAAYEEKISELKGLDLLILGVGANGHIGYNEPGSFFDSRTREIRLAPESVSRIFTPLSVHPVSRGLTIGIGTILESREILLLASGPSKRKSMAAFFNGPDTTEMPVTALRLHSQLTVILDRDADPRPDGK